MDDLLVADRKKFSAVVDSIEEKGISAKCTFNILLRANIVDNELCKLLKRLNTFSAVIGIESFNDKILEYYNKSGVTAKINQAAIDLLNTFDIPVSCCFIFGAPIETKYDLIETLINIYINLRDNKIISAYWSILKPYPGTEIWKYAENKGLVDNVFDWDRYVQRCFDKNLFFSTSNNEIMLCESMDRHEFMSILNYWFDKFSTIKRNWGYGHTE